MRHFYTINPFGAKVFEDLKWKVIRQKFFACVVFATFIPERVSAGLFTDGVIIG